MKVNRRAFLRSAMAAGLAVPAAARALAQGSPGAAGGASPPGPDRGVELGGLLKDDLPTPALLVDLDAFEANLKLMAEHCRRSGCGFRPHAKTHKCPEVARRQVASGALGVSVATVPEAEAMAAAGIRGLLLTSPIVERRKVARMIDLARKGGELILAVGHPREVDLLSQAARAAGVTVDVLVDVDVGDRRTGCLPGEPAAELARAIAKAGGLRLRGIQAYSGSSSHTVGFEARRKASREAMAKAVATRDLLARAGFEVSILSGGSTGTYNIDSAITGVTELQVGSYIFMDANYRGIGGKDGSRVYGDFHPSLTVLTTVVSASHVDQVTVDGGIKAFSTDVLELPEAKGRDGLTYRRFGDEFGAVTARAGAALPGIGERVEFIVPHCDPTVNLYDRIHAVRGGRVEAIWPIAARRETA